MNAQQLKNSILQEAIEGRLVPQDPNDEPASVLLDKIRKEKARLVKEKKIKADKNESYIYRSEDGHWMEHFEDKKRDEVCVDNEIPFDIPKGWEWCRFSSLYWLLTDGTHSTPKYTLDGIPFLSVKDMSSGKLSFDNTKFISHEEHAIISQRCHPQRGDLLLSKVGTTGIPLIIDTDKEFSIFVSLALIKFFPYLLDSRFLSLLINSPLVQTQVKEETRGIGNKNWVLTAISNTLMVLPPLAEQKRIVKKIEELLPKVEAYGKAQEKLNKLNEELPEKLKKSILQEAIEGRLVPQDPNDEPASVLLDKIRKEKARLVKEGKLKKKDLEETPISEDEIPFKIPESWEWCRMQDVIDFINGRAYKKEELLDKGKYKVLRVGNFFTNENWYFSDLELPDDKYCYKEDLLYAWSASFGPKIWNGDKTIFHYHIWNVKYNKDVLFRDYLYYYFLIDKERIKSSTTGSTMIHVSMENMKPRLIPLPPLAEQKRIVEKLEQLLNEVDKLKN